MCAHVLPPVAPLCAGAGPIPYVLTGSGATNTPEALDGLRAALDEVVRTAEVHHVRGIVGEGGRH